MPPPADDDSESESDSIWLRRLSFRDGQIKIRVQEEWGAGIGGTLWEGAVLMARWLSCDATFHARSWQRARCIELGAGATGIPGIVAAHLGCFREVVITDIEECMERLRENVIASLPPTAYLGSEPIETTAAAHQSETTTYQEGSATADAHHIVPAAATSASSPGWDGKTCVRIEELDWRQSADHLRSPYDVVLVADVLYAEELVDPLLATLQRFSGEQSLVAIAIYNRSERTSALFWERLPRYFSSSEKVPEACFASPTQANDIGIFILHH